MADFKRNFRFREERLEYDIKLRKKFPWWWLLLILLPLLLLIRCQKDLTVKCLYEDTGEVLSGQDVSLSYTEHYIVKYGRWFSADTIKQTKQTDTLGIAIFDKLPCSVYSFVFHGLQKGLVSLRSECFDDIDYPFVFHYTRRITLNVSARRDDLHVRVVDAETGEPIPDAIVRYVTFDGGSFLRDSSLTDIAGTAILPQIRYCSRIDTLTGRCFGYFDDIKTNLQCRDLLVERDSTTLRLQPVKERFTFFVKNVNTKEPIPDAVCNVTLTFPGNSQKTVSRVVRTSIDGRGIAVYNDAPIVSTLSIHASKVNYKDSVLANGPTGPWRVADFINQSDDVRTVWLEPVPYLQEFVNIDSLSMRPVPGTTNEITVTHPDGSKTNFTEVSNQNGVFPIAANEDDKIDVVSRKGNDYKVKYTLHPKFGAVEDRRILMQPETIDLEFRTVQADSPFPLLPDCSLVVTGSISGSLPPINSGNGTFIVTMRTAETLSIIASKRGFKTNSTQVCNMDAAYLSINQYRRDIPMEWDLPPCNGGIQSGYSGPGSSTNSYSMGQMVGSASIWVDFYSIGDYLTVYDGPSTTGRPIIKRLFIENQQTIPFSFTQGSVTVVIESGIGSSGVFEVRCPY